jgi:hypothetical protein
MATSFQYWKLVVNYYRYNPPKNVLSLPIFANAEKAKRSMLLWFAGRPPAA